jgi:ATP-dependent RNA helicase DOB1
MWLDANALAFKNAPRIKQSDLAGITPGPAGVNGKEGRMEVVPVTLATVDAISSLRVKLPSDLKTLDQRLDLRKTVEEVKRRFPDGVPVLDPVKNMHIKDESFKNLVKVIPYLISSDCRKSKSWNPD